MKKLPRNTRQPFQADAPTADGIGLALSGGGFRATLFHLGSLIRLNELGLLSQIDSISAVSGGSILSGLLASRWNDLDFVDGTAANLMEVVFEPIWAFCGLNVDVKAGVLGLVLGIRSPWKGVTGETSLEIKHFRTYQTIPNSSSTQRTLRPDATGHSQRLVWAHILLAMSIPQIYR